MKRALALVAAILLCAGCSLRVTRPDGRETYIGLLWMTVDPAGKTMVLHTKRLGLCVDAGDKANGILIGYQDTFRLIPPDDRVLHLDYRDRGPVVRLDVDSPRDAGGCFPEKDGDQ